MDFAAALRALDEHTNYERTGRVESPSIDRMVALMDLMGSPQLSYPVIHLTGTNGKGSTAAITTALLMEQGLNVGTISSPHLERINERMARNTQPIDDAAFAQMVSDVINFETMLGARLSYFEIVTAAGLRWFADEPIDVAVVEVGMLGRWDATNVVDADIAVITNIGMDHNEYAGPTRAHIAREKAGIIKPRSIVVCGETDPELVSIFMAAGGDSTLVRELDFDVVRNDLAVGGRLIDLRTPSATYPDVFLSLNGAHQGVNASAALMAVEAFFDATLDPEVVNEALGSVRMPGRFEVVGNHPLTIIDGAHNPAGADVCVGVLDDDFDVPGERILVVGFLNGRDPQEMLTAIGAERADLVICCTPPTPRAHDAETVQRAAQALGIRALAIDDVRRACDAALSEANDDDVVLVTGSLYVVGAARAHLINRA
jgi:dihydrofolate synthase / folylpolyglutamate synthase